MAEVGIDGAATEARAHPVMRRVDALVERHGLTTLVLAVLAAGLALRLLLAATTVGSLPDLNAFRGVHAAWADDPLRFYAEANPEPGRYAWPYLPGFIPILEAAFKTESVTGLPFDRLIRLPAIAADVAIAWLVQWHLGWRGASDRIRLAAVTLLALSPVGLALTGAHGQIDPLEWLPVVLAIVAWDRLPPERRALVAGLLIGLGIALKPPAALAGLAFFALARDTRERVVLTVAGAALPFLAFAPFVLADAGNALGVLDYQSVPGQGGLSLIVQPDLALARFAGKDVDAFNGANDVLQDLAPLLVALTSLGVAALAWRRRTSPESTIAALALAVFVVSPNFLPPYLIWVLPFAVLAGWWRFALAALALSLLVLPFKYLPARFVGGSGLGNDAGLWDEWVVAAIYVPGNVLLWALMAWQLYRWLRGRLDRRWVSASSNAPA